MLSQSRDTCHHLSLFVFCTSWTFHLLYWCGKILSVISVFFQVLNLATTFFTLYNLSFQIIFSSWFVSYFNWESLQHILKLSINICCRNQYIRIYSYYFNILFWSKLSALFPSHGHRRQSVHLKYWALRWVLPKKTGVFPSLSSTMKEKSSFQSFCCHFAKQGIL